ncbi:MFS transporter [Kribbella antibiotica]|uniref:MFS transporter n=1 Tax=Kribbella antibiotica TaxID=190195 RepID=A0A4R4ZHJ3_9ACTN|nr:MFS transporter [Kribbella antibiotica]TDD58033.1 MFS transporter [Kribbella antibiotica]
MRARGEAMVLLLGGGVADLAYRFTQVALPLVILHETGSVAATGLVGGAAGIPVLLSPWWARRARQWVDSGPRLAMVAGVSAIALAIVPAAAAFGLLSPWLLVVSGLFLGCGDALGSPGRTALLADIGDRWGAGMAVTLLTWQDGVRRVGMVVGPVLGALAVAAGVTSGLLWIEAGAVLAAGLAGLGIRGEGRGPGGEAPSIRAGLVGRREVGLGWVIRGTGCVTWFAFTLGLSVVGAERGEPGVYLAAGMSGYGVGAVAGTVVALRVVRRVAAMPLASGAWAVVGLCWAGMGVWTSPASVAVLAGLAGVAVVWGIAAISAIITRSSDGADRRALLSGQSVVVNASSSAGLLIGGSVIAAVGAEATLIGAGLLTTLVAGLVGWSAAGRMACIRTGSSGVR